ncbi:MAG: hypothetical protein ACLT0Y_06195 [Christensenellales bacterium]
MITDSQMQVFNSDGKLIMRSTDDRPAKFLLKGQSDKILELIRTSVQTVLENGYTVIETHDLNEEIGEIYTVITPIYKDGTIVAVVALTMPASEIKDTFKGLVPVLFLSMLAASLIAFIRCIF